MDTPKLLLVDIIEKCCNKAVVRELKNVTRCLHVKNAKSDPKDQSVSADFSMFHDISTKTSLGDYDDRGV